MQRTWRSHCCEGSRARVLLLELNLRAPTLGRLFGFEAPWCVSQQVTAHREAPDRPLSVVQPVPTSLHVAALASQSPNQRPLDGPSVAAIMGRYQRDYDYIVIDGPAVLGNADVNVLQDSADGIVLTARFSRTRANHLARAQEQLGGTQIVGVVLVEGGMKAS